MDKEQIYEEINKGIDYSNGNRVWKAIGDLIDLERAETQKKVEEFIKEIKTICPNSLFNKEVNELRDKIFGDKLVENKNG